MLIAAVFAVTAIGAGGWSLDALLGVHAAGVDWALGQLLAGVAGAAAGVALGRHGMERHAGARPAAAGA